MFSLSIFWRSRVPAEGNSSHSQPLVLEILSLTWFRAKVVISNVIAAASNDSFIRRNRILIHSRSRTRCVNTFECQILDRLMRFEWMMTCRKVYVRTSEYVVQKIWCSRSTITSMQGFRKSLWGRKRPIWMCLTVPGSCYKGLHGIKETAGQTTSDCRQIAEDIE